MNGPDLDAIERDLADVERALARLDDGTYWTNESWSDEIRSDEIWSGEITGAAIADEVLTSNPIGRRVPNE